MTDKITRDAVLELRQKWFNDLVALTCDGTRLSESTERTPLMATALASLTILGGHLLGAQDDALVLPNVSVEDVGKEIGRWRTGRGRPRLARHWEEGWLSLFRYARDESLLTSDLLAAFASSPCGEAAGGRTQHDLRGASDATLLREFIERILAANTGRAWDQPMHNGLDLQPNHLSVVAAGVDLDLALALKLFTPIEILATLPDEDEDLLADSWMMSSRGYLRVYLTAVGEWPGSAPGGVPEHVADWVLKRDGRQGNCTTGFVPGWFATAESEADLDAIRRLAFAGGVALELSPSRAAISLLTPDADGQPTNLAPTYFVQRTTEQLQDLAVLVAMGCVTLHRFYIDANRQLSYDGSHLIRLPEGALHELRDWIGPTFQGWTMDSFMSDLPDSNEEARLRAVTGERRRFELARLVRARLDGQLRPELSSALGDYLSALRRAGATGGLGGASRPETAELETTRGTLRSLVNGSRSIGVDQLDVDVLGAERAYLQFEATQSGIQWVSASWKHGNTTVHRVFEYRSAGRPRPWRLSDQSAWLAESLGDLQSLALEGIRHVVLSPSSEDYGAPYHQALLSLGFETASYAPSLDLLRPVDRPLKSGQPSRNYLAGWPSEGDTFLPGVAAELEALEDDLGCRVETDLRSLSGPFRTIHLTGHARAGSHEASTAIDLGPAGRLTAVDLLERADLAGSGIALLCACSTGEGVYWPMQLQDNTPLDVCFLAVGVQTVVSTCRPVGDVSALLFALEFHHEVLSGVNPWSAYSRARHVLRAPYASSVAPAIAKRLDGLLPDWRERSLQSDEDDWLAFRIAGRHWAER